MTGDLTIGGVTVPVDTGISDIFTESDFAFGLQMQAEAWYKRRWGLLFNGQRTVLKKNDNVISLPGPAPPFFPGPGSVEFDLKMNMGLFEFDVAYDFGQQPFGGGSRGPTWEVQPFVGARVTVINNEIDLDGGGSNDPGKTWADPILGARGRIRFGNDNRLSCARVTRFINSLSLSSPTPNAPRDWSVFDVADQAFDAMQGAIARQKIAAYPPGLVIEIARNCCGTMEFDRADEMIQLGYEKARALLGQP